MKSLSIYIGALFLIANIVILTLLTNCTNIVIIMSSSVILTTTLFTFVSGIMHIKDAFKISLPFLFAFMGIIEYILSFFINSESVKNDSFFVSIILLFLCQLFCLIIINKFSHHG